MNDRARGRLERKSVLEGCREEFDEERVEVLRKWWILTGGSKFTCPVLETDQGDDEFDGGADETGCNGKAWKPLWLQVAPHCHLLTPACCTFTHATNDTAQLRVTVTSLNMKCIVRLSERGLTPAQGDYFFLLFQSFFWRGAYWSRSQRTTAVRLDKSLQCAHSALLVLKMTTSMLLTRELLAVPRGA